MAEICTKVLALPSQEGRKPRKPVTMLIVAEPTTINTSRLMTAAVTQKGTGRWLPRATMESRERVMKEVTRRSLCDGVENGAELGFLVEAAREEAVDAVGQPGEDEDGERPFETLVVERR